MNPTVLYNELKLIREALQSVAKSLEKMANPPVELSAGDLLRSMFDPQRKEAE